MQGSSWTSELGCRCFAWPGEDAQAAFCRQNLPVTLCHQRPRGWEMLGISGRCLGGREQTVKSTEDKPPRSRAGNWPLPVLVSGTVRVLHGRSQSRSSGCALTVSLPACHAAWGWLYLQASKDKLHHPRRETGTAAP